MQLHFPGKKESVCFLSFIALFLIMSIAFIGLRSEHIFLAILISGLFFSGVPLLKKFVIAMMPFLIFAMSYDWMRLCPNYEVNPVDIKGLYETEKSIFGVAVNGQQLTLNEFFALHKFLLADILAGVFYLCWVPLPLLFGIILFFKGKRELYLHFSIAFLLVNLIGFAGYYIHPAAPPWYVMYHGFDFDLSTPGNVAGLGAFDELTGLHIFEGLYGRNANIFAAVPSLHAAYMTITFFYAVKGHCALWVKTLFAIVMVGIWWTALYTAHHYLIDVLLGITCTFLGIALLECCLLRWSPFRRFFNGYNQYIA